MKLRFNIDKLSLGESRCNIVLNKDDVNIIEDIDNIKAIICVEKSGNIYKSKGFIEYDINLECSRCLEIFNQHQKSEFKCEFKERSEYKDNDNKLDGQGNEYLIINKVIDFEPLFHDLIILSIPMKPLCSPYCKGLCPICGKILNKEKCKHLNNKEITINY